ncbi:receptor-like protein kinase FERONIA [Prunus avium]|uniref:Receptor-like protein kinase FERONIA n=2 Tax=Prunus avium TaxID=42229 RepID=A0A6P5SSD8_PRUAV|nr:receptor-like protein kinase FERONIA [Prunus avium]
MMTIWPHLCKRYSTQRSTHITYPYNSPSLYFSLLLTQASNRNPYTITMMKPILSRPLYFSLFVHLIIVTVLAASDPQPIYSPVEDITVNCGYSGNWTSEDDGRNWIGDINSKFSPFEHQAVSNKSEFKEAPHSYNVQQVRVPYTTVRLSRSEFTYSFKLSSGQKFIRLYFNPVSYGPDFDQSKALFSVKAGNFTLLHDFNASVTAAAFNLTKIIYREFCLNIDEEKSLNITFTPSRTIPDAYGFINGIEIVSMPTNLYYSPPESESFREIKMVGSGTNFRIENRTALQMMYRINIGGDSLLFKKDTGMYRNWVAGYADELYYLDDLSLTRSLVPQNISTQLNFSEIPAYTAPEEVYRTGRSMGRNDTLNKSYNLTWGFPVDSKFYYLVRLHFCEFQHAINQTYDRTFAIYMDNQTAETNADIIQWSGGNDRPVYKDYLVFIPEGHQHLFLALGANPSDQTTTYSDALLNGLEIFKIDSQGNLAGPNPVPPPMILPKGPSKPNSNNKKSRPPMLAIVGGVVISSTLAALCALGFLVFRQRWKAKESDRSSHGKTNSTNTRGSSLPSELCHHFSLAEIKAGTQNFNDICIIGRGGFGNVYKGYIGDGATPVAVKRLKPESSQGAREFKTEIEMLSQLRHRHLVPLIGYCTDEGEMILVYEYMAHGTLHDHLYHTDNPTLSWEERLQICIGAARGLHYLHTGAKYTIIHRDVKSTNILLDEKWVAKVSDFGLSKMGTITMSKTHISTMVKGSFGYLDPEYYRRQQLTVKSDVYSFGVVLCEVLCARPALIRTVEKKQTSLAEWAKNCHRNGALEQIIDPSLKGKIETHCFNKFAEIAMSCLHDNGTERPSMNDVLSGIEFALELQRGAEKDIINNTSTGRKREDEVTLTKDMQGFSSSEKSCATSESITGMSGTIFSEINDSEGR